MRTFRAGPERTASVSELPTEPALRQAAFLADLARDRTFLDSLILP